MVLKSLDGCVYFVKGKFFYKKKFDTIYKKIILEFLKDVIALHILYTVRADME